MNASTLALLVLTTTSTACLELDLASDETGEQTSDIANGDPDGEGTPSPPPPAPPPPNGNNVLRISSIAINDRVVLLLGTSLITVDTTGTSPVRQLAISPQNVCTFPNQAAREDAYAACAEEYSGSALVDCFRDVDIELPNIKDCHVVTHALFHSYLDFSLWANNGTPPVADIGFNVTPMYKDTDGPGGVTINANYIRSANANPTASFGPTYANPEPTASAWLLLQSNSPTLPCVHSILGSCNIDLANMRVLVRFPGIGPGPVAGVLTAESAVATFYFDLNQNYLPNYVVTALADVFPIIRGAVEGRLTAALQSTQGRAAINAMLTDLALIEAKKTHPNAKGFSRIRQTWYEAGNLVLAYDWYE